MLTGEPMLGRRAWRCPVDRGSSPTSVPNEKENGPCTDVKLEEAGDGAGGVELPPGREIQAGTTGPAGDADIPSDPPTGAGEGNESQTGKRNESCRSDGAATEILEGEPAPQLQRIDNQPHGRWSPDRTADHRSFGSAYA